MSFFTARYPRASKALFLASSLVVTSSASALDFDWHGQFRAETNWLFGYSHGNLATGPASTANNGYNVPLNGDSPASFQNLFFRLRPRAIVNDNLTVHSDLWLGTPDRGFFGGDQTGTSNFYTTNTGNAAVTANTLYAEVATDFGTITVGRAPLNWGLGLIWNNNQEGFDRFPSTGDAIRLETKLGAFRFIPGVIKYRNGTNIAGGSTLGTGATTSGGSGVSDYTVGLTYNNDDEQIDLGILFMRRIAGVNSQIVNPYSVDTATNAGYAYNVWDFSAKKRAGIFTFAAEVPLSSGLIASQDFSSVAGAAKVTAQLTDAWSVNLNVGSADGQESNTVGSAPKKFSAFYFHPDYRPGLVMFNYNLRSFSSNTASPYDNPVTNARFLSLGVNYASGKWAHGLLGLYAMADKTCDGVAGTLCFNTQDRIYRTQAAGATAQDKGLGFEMDYSIGYQWDEAFHLGLTSGLFFPGKFYEYSNSATPNKNETIFATTMQLLVKF